MKISQLSTSRLLWLGLWLAVSLGLSPHAIAQYNSYRIEVIRPPVRSGIPHDYYKGDPSIKDLYEVPDEDDDCRSAKAALYAKIRENKFTRRVGSYSADDVAKMSCSSAKVNADVWTDWKDARTRRMDEESEAYWAERTRQREARNREYEARNREYEARNREYEAEWEARKREQDAYWAEQERQQNVKRQLEQQRELAERTLKQTLRQRTSEVQDQLGKLDGWNRDRVATTRSAAEWTGLAANARAKAEEIAAGLEFGSPAYYEVKGYVDKLENLANAYERLAPLAKGPGNVTPRELADAADVGVESVAGFSPGAALASGSVQLLTPIRDRGLDLVEHVGRESQKLLNNPNAAPGARLRSRPRPRRPRPGRCPTGCPPSLRPPVPPTGPGGSARWARCWPPRPWRRPAAGLTRHRKVRSKTRFRRIRVPASTPRSGTP